ncbi:acyl carrier protein [Actinomadura luteofluorescens]|uniref:acyl carrier protein n=1 Tax=Actinomadura luteofluorescens TaxID=46163 RepID=UPI0034825297
MPDKALDLNDLRRIIQESAGVDQGVDLDDDISDIEFQELGYDSIAVMEVAARITRDYGVTIDDETLADATTPRLLLDAVNGG